MKILLVGNYEPDAQQSMQRYAVWLQQALTARGYAVTLLRPHVCFSLLTPQPLLRKYLGYLDKFFLFPYHLKRMAKLHDLVHVLDHSNAMYLGWLRSSPCVITCHDLLAIRAAQGEFAETATGWTGRLLQRWILHGLRTAPYVACVSAKTQADFQRLTGRADRFVRVLPHALHGSFLPGVALPSALRERLGMQPGQRYLFHVGANHWYKNRTGVLRLFARLIEHSKYADLRIVLAGESCNAAMHAVIAEQGLTDRVLDAGAVTNEELQALYGNAQALLFPSLEEGFGWPILEAQACGCVVVTSNRAPMTEVAGEAAILIDPTNPKAAAQGIVEGLNRAEALRTVGFCNLLRFEDAAALDRYGAFYEEIVVGRA